jgi:hypothetical protein
MNETAEAFVIVGFVLLIPVFFFLFALVAWRTQMLIWGKGKYPETGWLNQWAHRWARSVAYHRKHREEWRKANPPKPKAVKSPKAAPVPVAPASPPDDSSADSRLDEEFEKFKRDRISLDDYRDAIEFEMDDAKTRRAELRAEKRYMDSYLYELEMEEVEADIEAAEWRLQWVKDHEYKNQFKRDGFAESGKWARFDYVDKDGEISKRNIANWEQRGAYIVGWDRAKKAERTFRQDRISDWVSG